MLDVSRERDLLTAMWDPGQWPFSKSVGMAVRNGGLMGFLAMTFTVVGLTGVFASYAAPLPLERAQQRESAFDDVLATDLTESARAALRSRLGEDAAAVLDGSGVLATRVQAARVAARARFAAESDAVGTRIRLLLAVVTIAAGLFGVALLNIASRKT